MEILEAYVLFLSRDWIQNIKGFMDANLTKLWLYWNGKTNKIRKNRESYMKHIIIDINDVNEGAKEIIF